EINHLGYLDILKQICVVTGYILSFIVIWLPHHV
ncbi:unnamed protein product, partial [Lathyrus sativus]